MVSNQVLAARAAAGLIVLSLSVCGCAHFHHGEQAPSASSAPEPVAPSAATPAATAAPAEDMTATEAAIASAGAGQAPGASPAETTPVPVLNPNAPKHYVVKRGDTLWGIASMYLRDPWLWPEVWVINPQVVNPHLIYPGDKLALAYGANGRPQVMLEQAGAVRLDPRLRSTPLQTEIPTIPYSAIAAFLSRPTVMSSEEIRDAPYVFAFRDLHQVAGTGNEVYVRHLTATENSRFAVIHVAGKLRDPDDGVVVGYEGIYTATALVQRPGEPAKALLIDPARETVAGDRLLSANAEDTPTTFTPRPPTTQVRGRIIDVVGGTDLVGQFEVVVINRGKRHGLEPGSVLAIDGAGDVVPDLYRHGMQIGDSNHGGRQFAPSVRLPDERAGTLLVFKVYDRVSFGLIVGASDTIHTNDVVRNP
jgi:LysM repeat protein